MFKGMPKEKQKIFDFFRSIFVSHTDLFMYIVFNTLNITIICQYLCRYFKYDSYVNIGILYENIKKCKILMAIRGDLSVKTK